MLSGVVFPVKRIRADWARLVVIDVIFEKGEGGKFGAGSRNAVCAKYQWMCFKLAPLQKHKQAFFLVSLSLGN